MVMLASALIMSYLQSNYPGGLKAFIEEKGLIALTPNKILLYIPKEVEFLREKLTAVVAKVGVKIQFVTTFNFDGKNETEIMETCIGCFNKIAEALPDLEFAPSVGMIALSIQLGKEPTPEELNTISEILDGTEGLVRWYIVLGDKTLVERDSTEYSTIAKIVVEQVKRSTPIDAIDVGALHQTLGQCETVEDFLKAF